MKKCPHANRGNRCVDYYEHPLRVKPLREAPAILIMEQRMCRKRGSCKSTKSTTRRSRPRGIQRLAVDGCAPPQERGFSYPRRIGDKNVPAPLCFATPDFVVVSMCRFRRQVFDGLPRRRRPTNGGRVFLPTSVAGWKTRAPLCFATHNSQLATRDSFLPFASGKIAKKKTRPS